MDVASLIPEHIDSECSLIKYKDGKPCAVCSSNATIKLLTADLNIKAEDPVDALNILKTQTNCDTERCVLDALKHKHKQQISAELFTNFKHPGPTDDKLLSNYNIDDILKQYSLWFNDFTYLNFNMRNYADYSFRDGYIENNPDTLATVKVSDWYPAKKKLGCVINTDTYQGPGKHWMALFVDTTVTPCSVEFFNSSGNAPLLEYQRWLEKTKLQLEDLKLPAKTYAVSKIQHQDSRSECGVYSLLYIYARLKGIPVEVFQNKKIDDALCFHFRQLIFTGKAIFDHSKTGGKFDWNAYQKVVPIKWE